VAVVRFPNELSTTSINAQLAKALKNLSDQDYAGNVIVVSPGKVRVRRKK